MEPCQGDSGGSSSGLVAGGEARGLGNHLQS